MSLFDSINRPKWQHKDPEVRKAAIGQTDDQAVLVELVKTDVDFSVQAKALSRINNPDTLDTLVDTLAGALQQQARSQRLQQLLPDPETLVTINGAKKSPWLAYREGPRRLYTSSLRALRSRLRAEARNAP